MPKFILSAPEMNSNQRHSHKTLRPVSSFCSQFTERGQSLQNRYCYVMWHNA